MTLREALALFRQYKGKRLTSHDWKRLQRASQVIRAAAKKRNPKRISNRQGLRKNPARQSKVVVYSQLLRIEAKKGQRHRCDAECVKAGHSYYHDFKPGAVIYGLTDGSIHIVGNRGQRLWKMF
jgi:hypothetical protein